MLLVALLLSGGARVAADTPPGLAALARGDYPSAWREFMTPALRGEAEAQAGLGAMLFEQINPPGTGTYADSERWLAAAAARGSVKGMTYLARFYQADGARLLASVDTRAIAMATRHAAELQFIQARRWFERAAAVGDAGAASRLADMLDAGAGGPRDPARAARLRTALPSNTAGAGAFVPAPRALDPAIRAAWTAGRYREALAVARPLAEQGDPRAQALLGRAFYGGTGLPRDYTWARYWLERAADRGDADARFFLGLMFEHGRGGAADLPRAAALLARAAAGAQPDAAAEAAGMRAARNVLTARATLHADQAAETAACRAAGGSAAAGLCQRAGEAIDPYRFAN